MKNRTGETGHQDPLVELDSEEIAAVSGGRIVYVDGMAVEMSEHTLSAMINSGAVSKIVIKGVEGPWRQRPDW